MHITLTERPCRSVPFGMLYSKRSVQRRARAFVPSSEGCLKPLVPQSSRRECVDVASEYKEPNRRQLLASGAALAAAASTALLGSQLPAAAADSGIIAKYEPMDALKGKDYGKPRMTYKDYTTTSSGLQFQDLRVGEGEIPQPGDTAIVDWDGYTIGYYGRPFEARNKPKGSSFSGDNKDFFRFVLGSGKVIPAFEEAVASMKPGGIRRIIVPVELGYPVNDWRSLGPKPTTFAGDRALDFVLANRGMIDKTLLFDVELVKVLRPQQ